MDENFTLRAALKSDGELHQCIDDREKYLPETVEAAVAELQTRGVEFSEEELNVIAQDMEARRELAASNTDNFVLYSNGKNTQIDDPEAPSYYSKRAILVFSVLFSVFFGSVMLAVNVAKTQNKSMAIWVAVCGLGYSVATVLIGQSLNLNSGFAMVFGWTGAYIMDFLFWNRYIGKSTLYRAKPIWIPLIIGLAISIPLIMLVMYSGAYK